MTAYIPRLWYSVHGLSLNCNNLLVVALLHCVKELRTPEVQVTTGQKLCIEIICTILQTSVTVLNIFSKEIISYNTKCQKQSLKFV